MARFYTEISKNDFLTVVEEVMGNEEFPYELPARLEKDLKKVNFDWENFTPFGDDRNFTNYPVGYRELAPGFHVYFVNAGGDWEYPICFCFYWGDGELRAYIPKEGNAWNKEEKCAYGSEDDADYDKEHDDEVDEGKIIEDILNRIVKVGYRGVY